MIIIGSIFVLLTIIVIIIIFKKKKGMSNSEIEEKTQQLNPM